MQKITVKNWEEGNPTRHVYDAAEVDKVLSKATDLLQDLKPIMEEKSYDVLSQRIRDWLNEFGVKG